MNIIHSTFKQESTVYTVVGDSFNSNNPHWKDIGLIILNRGGKPFRQHLFEKISSVGFGEVLSIELGSKTSDIEELANAFPGLRFLIFPDKISRGEAINIAFQEVKKPYIMVIWNDLAVGPKYFNPGIIDKIKNKQILCQVPVLHNEKEEVIPSFVAPAFDKKKLKTLFLISKGSDFPSLFPFDYVGLYHRDSFLTLGGFDVRFLNPYWQKLDFGFRAHMWGASIEQAKGLRFSYKEVPAMEDTTFDKEYLLFYLKNLAVRYTGDTGVIPRSRIFRFLSNSSGPLYHNFKLFKDTRLWVKEHKYHFQRDARSVTELWRVND